MKPSCRFPSLGSFPTFKSVENLMKPSRLSALLLGAILALTAASSASAQILTTSTLGVLVADHGSLTVGDKTFSNFNYVASQLGTDPANLTVTVSIANGIYYLDWSGIIAVNNLAGTGSVLGDVKLSYTVTANPGSIAMIDQNYTPNADADARQPNRYRRKP